MLNNPKNPNLELYLKCKLFIFNIYSVHICGFKYFKKIN